MVTSLSALDRVTDIGQKNRMRCIRIARTLLGISVERLAAQAHVSPRELRRIEQREVTPHPTTLARLDDALSELLLARQLQGVQNA